MVWIGRARVVLPNEADALVVAACPLLLAAAKWALHQFQGDSGTGESYWETVPGYDGLKNAIERAEGRFLAD